MQKDTILCFFTLAISISHVWSFGVGAPPNKCGPTGDMTPSHSSLPGQTSSVPYTLTTSTGDTSYTTEQIITITIGGGGTFKGFIIQAKDESGSLAGFFTATDSCAQVLSCGGVGNSGLTHTSGIAKTSCEYQWEAPPNNVGDITFYVTFVQDYSTFWVQETPLTLSVSTSGGGGSGTAPVTNPPQSQTTFVSSTTDSNKLTSSTPSVSQGGSIMYDNECGYSKGCFADCSGQDCKFLVTWRDGGSFVQFELYGKPDPSFRDVWMAVGFSDDTRMGGDSVTECVFSQGQVQAFNSYNQGYSNRRLNPPQVGLSNVQGNFLNGVTYCTFRRQKSMNMQQEMFDLEQDWHIMFANGQALSVPAWRLSMHSTSDLPPTSASRVDYQSFSVIGGSAKFPLVKAHGCLMIFAWVMFTGIGIVAARYYKNVWADKTIMSLKIWFQIHRSCMVSALVLDVIAFIIIFVEVKGYSNIPDIEGKAYLKSHPVLGIIVTALCLANPLMALFRPAGDHEKRYIFNWAHWGVGMSAYILSAICICFGFQLGKSSTPDYAVYIMIVYVLYVILFDVVFEVMECLNKKEKTVKVDNIEMSNRNGTADNGNVPNGHFNTKDKAKKTDKVKTMLLAIHIAFTGAFALVLSLVVALN